MVERNAKLEHDGEHYRKELRELKRNGGGHHHESVNTKRESHKNSAFAYESKENRLDWGHRNTSGKK